ncbi:YraN family protein [Sphingobacteriales bacterium CHB3]|nr:YraN family protein [Sphingobacteriales bacterium CHB3]
MMFKHSTKQSGDEGEEIAKRLLVQKGLTIVETKYRFGKSGEIDIIARDGDVLVFCEVKMRKTEEYGDPEFAITPKKQAQVRKIAHAYLYERNIDNQECRFDVVAIKKIGGKQEINYIPNAF